jgi:type IV secretion system protein VirB8
MNKSEYFDRAESWGVSTQKAASRSQRTAWTIAGVLAGIAAFEAVALAMLVPLKTVQPVTLLVDRHTGYVQALNPLEQQRLSANDALTQSLLAQYVAAREGFDRVTVSANYRRVALWSAGTARSTYLTEMPATHPASPFQNYPAGAVGVVRVKSISKIGKGAALVRFDTQRQDRNGGLSPPQPWISVVRYRYTDAPMAMEDRLVNPMGFQVVGYRRDAEAAAAPPALDVTVAPAASAPVILSQEPAGQRTEVRPAPPAATRPTGTRSTRPAAVTGYVDDRAVPLGQIRLGSPLSSALGGPDTKEADL